MGQGVHPANNGGAGYFDVRASIRSARAISFETVRSSAAASRLRLP
jgi:hypothetical protein